MSASALASPVLIVNMKRTPSNRLYKRQATDTSATSSTTSASSTTSTTTTTSSAPTSSSTSSAPTTTSSSASLTTPTSATTPTSVTSATSATSATTPNTSSAPSSAASATSATSIPVVVVTYTTTDSNGALVTGLTSSANPTATATGRPDSGSGGGSDPNLGAIIGGVAGGVAGLIILIWLILLPLRRRAKKAKEVEWLSFGQENDHVNESSAEAVYGRGAGGTSSAEAKGGSVANVNEIQMDDMAHEMAQQPYHYQNIDNGAAWGAAGAAGAGAGMAGAAAYARHDQYAQHPQDGYDAYYAQQGYAGPHYQQYAMQPQQGWAAQPQGVYPQAEAWGAAPGYTSPGQSQAHGNPGLSHNLSIGSTKVGEAGAGSQAGHKGSQEGHAANAPTQYGYQSPPLGTQSPQQYPQHYHGHAATSSPPMEAQYYQGHQQGQYTYAEPQQQQRLPDQRAGSPNSITSQARANNDTNNGAGGGLHLANP